jgi:small subunit ribosomal protein S20|tara:strand:- start:31 stop:297 length:267 start_codon:yes stop_codon:yes gene_type:complete
MPNTKSAINRVKRVKKQTLVNKLRKNKYKAAVKKIQKLLDKKDIKELDKYFPKFQSELMKIAKTGIIKKKNLSRKISKISKKIKILKK